MKNCIRVLLLLLYCFSPPIFAAADFEAEAAKLKAAVPEARTAERISVGKHLYAQRCARCHGVPGKTHGQSFFDAPPLSDGKYKFRSTPSGSNPRDADLLRSVTQGIPGTRMPGFAFLSAADRWALVLYMKSLSPYFEGVEEPEAVAIPAPPPVNPDRVQRGQLWYVLSRCTDCHGKEGRGDGPQAASLQNAQGRPIRPASFVSGSFKSGSAPEDLYRTLLTGLDGTPMAAFGEGTFLFPRESQKDGPKGYPALEALRPPLSAPEKEKLMGWIDGLPTQAQLDKMSPSARAALEGERRWELVYFIRSMKKGRR